MNKTKISMMEKIYKRIEHKRTKRNMTICLIGMISSQLFFWLSIALLIMNEYLYIHVITAIFNAIVSAFWTKMFIMILEKNKPTFCEMKNPPNHTKNEEKVQKP